MRCVSVAYHQPAGRVGLRAPQASSRRGEQEKRPNFSRYPHQEPRDRDREWGRGRGGGPLAMQYRPAGRGSRSAAPGPRGIAIAIASAPALWRALEERDREPGRAMRKGISPLPASTMGSAPASAMPSVGIAGECAQCLLVEFAGRDLADD